MRFKIALAAGAAIAIAVSGLTVSGLTVSGASARRAPAEQKGYLPPGALDTSKVLPPAPKEGEARYENDRKVFLATRALKDTPRWTLAQNDVDERRIVGDMACAMGFTPDPQKLPKLTAMLMKLRFDVIDAVNKPKDLYQRKRPYLIDEGPICVDKTEGLAKSPATRRATPPGAGPSA